MITCDFVRRYLFTTQWRHWVKTLCKQTVNMASCIEGAVTNVFWLICPVALTCYPINCSQPYWSQQSMMCAVHLTKIVYVWLVADNVLYWCLFALKFMRFLFSAFIIHGLIIRPVVTCCFRDSYPRVANVIWVIYLVLWLNCNVSIHSVLLIGGIRAHSFPDKRSPLLFCQLVERVIELLKNRAGMIQSSV